MNTKFNDEIYGLLPEGIEGIDSLVALALDIRWSWNHSADEIWKQLDAALWENTYNPWLVLQTMSRERLKQQMDDAGFREKINELMKTKEQAAASDAWFQKMHPDSPLKTVAYFSMEYMLSEALPIYVGGLGNVAGDQLKSASDLGVPVLAIGLLYQQGYFRQQIDKYGNQQALFPYNDPGQLPVTPLRLPDGEWLRFQINLSGYPLWIRAWQVHVGRLKLYLMDSNDPANLPAHRGITSEIYGGDSELRIKQEILLGIGGLRLLHTLNIKPEVCHLNEGHAAFLVLERANQFKNENGVSFEEALAVTRAGNIFTTHTAVAAGFDHFSPALMWQYFGDYATNELHIDFDTLMGMGRQDTNNGSEYFNMAYLAMRGSRSVNAVSKLHGKVSRKLFSNLFSRWPLEEIPVGSVTNGVHSPSWDSEFADELWTNACGKDRWKGELKTIEQDIAKISDDTLWNFRNQSRNNFVNYVRKRFETQTIVSGLPASIIEAAKNVFDPHTLTLGFARRFVPYKRPNLLLHDPERFIRILTNSQCPVQLVIAGKAPPFDENGKSLIREWNHFIQQHDLYKHVIFLSDYDMLLTEQLVQGVDVWVNTPRRPWEACGTSGMKVLVNGGINLSELDGWWAEAHTSEVGWALGDKKEHGDDPAWNTVEANTLYDLLEQQIVPEFYSRNENGIPVKWIERMRNSMATLTAQFSANRTVREYTEKFYLTAAAEYMKRAADKGHIGKEIMDAKHLLHSKWNEIHFGEVKTEATENGFSFDATIFFDDDLKDKISIEIFAMDINNGDQEIIKMNLQSTSENNNEHIYLAEVNTGRKLDDYTLRIIPCYENIAVPIEDNLILWQR
ncbi:MAG TPA: alpha-glucan family phosphorylase [Hanamia sp.]|nr:alpha-glucan family phosphorylase [Hanamia sp.]